MHQRCYVSQPAGIAPGTACPQRIQGLKARPISVSTHGEGIIIHSPRNMSRIKGTTWLPRPALSSARPSQPPKSYPEKTQKIRDEISNEIKIKAAMKTLARTNLISHVFSRKTHTCSSKMRLIPSLYFFVILVFSSSCAIKDRPRGKPLTASPMLASEDFKISAGEPSPSGISLVRVLRNGLCLFEAWSDKPFEIEVAPGELIPEGNSDFYGIVISSDSKKQTAHIRSFDLGSPLP